MILSDLLSSVEVPLWVTIAVVIFAAIASFWEKIKSTFEVIIQGKNKLAEKKLDAELTELEKLNKRIKHLEDQNLKLVKSNTAYATAMMFIMAEYQKNNPENTHVIENLQSLIKQNLVMVEETP